MSAHSAGCSGHEDRVVVFMFRRHVADLGRNWRRFMRKRVELGRLERFCGRYRDLGVAVCAGRSGRAPSGHHHGLLKSQDRTDEAHRLQQGFVAGGMGF
jgi:hypothetical protein